MVSIIIPVYRVEQYIEECIKSICAQSYKDIEIILVNDGTPDNSIQIAERVLLDSNCLYRIIDKENGGLSSARNRGLLEANGDYVVFVDSDDTVQDDYIDVLLKGAEEMNSEISIGMWQMVKNDDVPDLVHGSARYVFIDREKLLQDFLYRRIKPAPVCALYNRQFLIENKLLYNEKVKFSEDQEFFWRTFNVCKGASYTERVIYNYYLRNNSITTDPQLSKIESGYKAIEAVSKSISSSDKDLRTFIVGRWVLGALHNTAKYCSAKFYMEMYYALDARNNIRMLYRFKSLSIRALAIICTTFPKLSYHLFKRII